MRRRNFISAGFGLVLAWLPWRQPNRKRFPKARRPTIRSRARWCICLMCGGREIRMGRWETEAEADQRAQRGVWPNEAGPPSDLQWVAYMGEDGSRFAHPNRTIETPAVWCIELEHGGRFVCQAESEGKEAARVRAAEGLWPEQTGPPSWLAWEP